MTKQSVIHLRPDTSLDRVIGYAVLLDDVEIYYVDSPSKKKALAFVERLQKAQVES